VSNASGTGTSAAPFIVIKAPTISSFTPLSGPVGTAVTISGTNLSDVTEVRFNGVAAARPEIVSPTSIRAIVPIGATSGAIVVTNGAGSVTSAAEFKLLPKIDSFTPAAAIPGTTVIITGTNLTAPPPPLPGVKFGAVGGAHVLSASDTEIRVTVPVGAVTGRITVTTGDGTAMSAASFTVIKPPTIATFTPAIGAVGTLVTISGTNLSSVADVRFNGVASGPAEVISASSIRVIVPSGATTGKISVTNLAGTAQSAGPFTVLP
jgi:hypothetical protein